MPGTQAIKDHGWRQGSVLPTQLAERVAARRFTDWSNTSDRAVVLSQDCDVVHSSYYVEPDVELIRATVSSAQDAIICHGRNPRRLQLETAAGEFLNLSVHDRWVVNRRELESHPPDPTICVEGDLLQILAGWIAKRYTRPAFPDEFNDRGRPATKKIETALKKSGKHVTGIFLAILPNAECSAEESYQVALRVTATKATLGVEALELELTRATQQIANALSGCDGIDIVDYALVSEAAFPLADLHFFQRWDWDYRSHSGEPGGKVAPVP